MGIYIRIQVRAMYVCGVPRCIVGLDDLFFFCEEVDTGEAVPKEGWGMYEILFVEDVFNYGYII